MAKKNLEENFEQTPVVEDEPLDTGGYEGQQVNQFNSFLVWGVNPYAGNGQAKTKDGVMVTLKNGGFKIPLVQFGVTDPSVLYKIGPEMKMSPASGDPYQVYGNTELKDVYIVGASPVYSAVAQGKIIDKGRKVTVPKGVWLRATNSAGEEVKGVMFTEIVLFIVFKNDPTRKVYRMICASNSTNYGKNIVDTLGQLAQTYQKLATKRFNKPVSLPAKFAFCVTLGIPEEPVAVKGGSFITPPLLQWKDGLPQTYEDIKSYMVDSPTYKELAEIAKEVDAYLASPDAPHAVGKLDAEFMAKVGVEQLADGSVVKMGALPPARNQTVGMIASATKPENMTVGQYLKTNSLDSFKALVASLGVQNPDDLVGAYPSVDQFTEIPGTISELVDLYKSSLADA